jgi:hypothetical protein
MQIRLKTQLEYLTVIGVYAPTEGDKESSEIFYNLLQEITNKVNKSDYLMVTGDLNARIGSNKVNSNISIHGEGTVNGNGKRLTDYVIYNNIYNNNYKVTNTFPS